ncbi:MAG TPA: amidohydrolase family protein [Rubrivivax sp.]|nr:amidohydrolase family protein [Rubrivivax sp.]
MNAPAEDVIDPALPICDPHHHLWDRRSNRYLLHELLADTGSTDARGQRHDVRSTVYVECASMYRGGGPAALRPVGETEFVNGIAAMSDGGGCGPTRAAAGIVAFADLCLGAAVGEVLQAHIDAAPQRLRGIRHAAGWHAGEAIRNSHSEPIEHLLLDKHFREGFAQLARFGLSFDAWLYHPQLPELTDLARAFPETTIVLDHFGGPLGIGPYAGQADAVYAQWRRDIDALARCPNVVAKLGGIHMPINGFGWHKRERLPGSQQLAEASARYVLHAIERFGPQRCMFESNFPVDKVSCSYLVLWNSFKRLAADFSAADKAALFHDTAARVYRLECT